MEAGIQNGRSVEMREWVEWVVDLSWAAIYLVISIAYTAIIDSDI